MSVDDSGEDLFITQSTFRTDGDVVTQEADEAATYLLDTSLDFLMPNSCPEVVEYIDFSHEHAQEILNIDSARKEEVNRSFVPLMADLFDDDDVDKVCLVLQLHLRPLSFCTHFLTCHFFHFSLLELNSFFKVDDNVLNGALDAVMLNNVDLECFGKPVSDSEVNDKKRKGYVNAIFNLFFLYIECGL